MGLEGLSRHSNRLDPDFHGKHPDFGKEEKPKNVEITPDMVKKFTSIIEGVYDLSSFLQVVIVIRKTDTEFCPDAMSALIADIINFNDRHARFKPKKDRINEIDTIDEKYGLRKKVKELVALLSGK
jgi:hypothetical protein